MTSYNIAIRLPCSIIFVVFIFFGVKAQINFPELAPISALDVKPDGSLIIFSSGNNIHLWDLNHPNEIELLNGHSFNIGNLEVLYDDILLSYTAIKDATSYLDFSHLKSL